MLADARCVLLVCGCVLCKVRCSLCVVGCRLLFATDRCSYLFVVVACSLVCAA